MATSSKATGAGGGGRRSVTDGPPPAAAPPAPPAAAIDLADSSLYLNRELSMLAFQRRVLEEARDERNPLLERVKFLAILGSNLGEFFMVRVAGLRQQVEAGVADLSADGMTPAEQLTACREQAHELMRAAREAWVNDVMPRAGRSRRAHPRRDGARRAASARPPRPTSTATSSPCSRRSPSTPAGRSPTSPT